MASRVLPVISVIGNDQKGVVARFATYMDERVINIEDIEQRVVRGIFTNDELVVVDGSVVFKPGASKSRSLGSSGGSA